MKKIFFCILILFNSTMLISQNVELNSVAKLHYTTSEISELLPVDVEKINYYYSETFVIDTTHPMFNKFVAQYCRDGFFDITNFENYRYYDSYNIFSIEGYYGLNIILTPWIAIEKKYIEIENKYN